MELTYLLKLTALFLAAWEVNAQSDSCFTCNYTQLIGAGSNTLAEARSNYPAFDPAYDGVPECYDGSWEDGVVPSLTCSQGGGLSYICNTLQFNATLTESVSGETSTLIVISRGCTVGYPLGDQCLTLAALGVPSLDLLLDLSATSFTIASTGDTTCFCDTDDCNGEVVSSTEIPDNGSTSVISSYIPIIALVLFTVM